MILGSPQQRNRAPKMGWIESARIFKSFLCQSLPYLEENEITLAIEPLSAQLTNFINRVEEAAEIIDALDHPLIKMMVDVHASADDARTIPELILYVGKRLGHFHANSYSGHRPGVGEPDFSSIIVALGEISYKGWVSVEFFKSIESPCECVRHSIEYLRACGLRTS